MKRISQFPKVSTIANNDRFLIDSKDPAGLGARSVSTFDLIREFGDKGDIYQTLDDQNIPVGLRRQVYRGDWLNSVMEANEDDQYSGLLNTTVTDEQWENIDNGSFKGMFIGDYWSFSTVTDDFDLSSIKWRIADFDYWYGAGDKSCTKHHVVIIPDAPLYKHVMNDTNTTAGGYMGSKMYTEGLNQAKEMINSAFGSAHILSHREALSNSVKDGRPNSGAWVDSTVELMNEPMVYGCFVYSPDGDGSTVAYRSSVDTRCLSLFNMSPIADNIAHIDYWLRDVVSGACFVIARDVGSISYGFASYNLGVRPVFGICKSNS